MLLHELQNRFRLHRLREVVALPVLASQFAQALHLPRVLNALGNGSQSHLLGQGGDQFDNIAGRAVRLHFPHQRAVNLQRIYGKLPQTAQGCRARAKIIQNHSNPQLLQMGEHAYRKLRISRRDALRDFQLQPRRGNA